jgi:PAS domain S-box-containing protein
VLPCLSTAITVHTQLLDKIPAALFFASIAITASFGFALQAALAIVFSFALFNYFLTPPIGHWTSDPEELMREAVLIAVSSLIAFLILRLNRAQADLAKAEGEIREALRLYEDQAKALGLAQQAGKSAAWVIDVEQDQVKFLPGGFEIFGFPFDDFKGRRPISFVEAEDRPAVEAVFRSAIQTGAPFQVEFRVRWPDGEMRTQEARGIRDPENPKLIRGTTFDITERKQAELSLLRIEKLAAVGRIASTIAHEINNPLASVTNLLYLALLDSTIAESTRLHLRTAGDELSRLSNITRLTLSYARPQTHAKEVDPREVIDSVLLLFRVRLQSKAMQVEQIYREPFRIHIFADELQRILTNLIANAIDAARFSGGLIRIELDRRGTEAQIAIEDNGAGIAPEHRDRVFDPFFTTKEDVGTGIGLWVTRELVEKNGGVIALQSDALHDGMRTRFELRFPLLAESN